MKKMLFVLFLLLACLLALPACAEVFGFAEVTQEVPLYWEPAANEEDRIGHMNTTDLNYLRLTGETAVDAEGVEWLQVRDPSNPGWLRRDQCTVVDGHAAMERFYAANYTDRFVSNGFVLKLTGRSATENSFFAQQFGAEAARTFGRNGEGEPVTYALEFYQADYNAQTGEFVGHAFPDFYACSWEDLSSFPSTDAMFWFYTPWKRLLEGRTSLCREEYQTADIRFGITTEHCTVYLPDDPALEGPQTLTFSSGPKLCTMHFTLVYKGGYTGSGEGWGVTDFECTMQDK